MSEMEEISLRPIIRQMDNNPSWWFTCLSYLKAFAKHPLEVDSSLMPQDKQILSAVRRLYHQCEETDREVMKGIFKGNRQELMQRRTRLICMLAVEARLTAFAIVPEPEDKIAERKEEKENEPSEQVDY